MDGAKPEEGEPQGGGAVGLRRRPEPQRSTGLPAKAASPPAPDCIAPEHASAPGPGGQSDKDHGPWPGGGSLLPEGGGPSGGAWQPPAQILKLADSRGALTETSTSAGSDAAEEASKPPSRGEGGAAKPAAEVEDRLEGTFGSSTASNEFSFGTTRPAALPPEAPRAGGAAAPSAPAPKRRAGEGGAAGSRPGSRPSSRPGSAKGAGARSRSPCFARGDGDDDCAQEFTFGTSAPLKMPDLSHLSPDGSLRQAAAASSSSAVVPTQSSASAQQATREREDKLAPVQEVAPAPRPAAEPRPATPPRPSTPSRRPSVGELSTPPRPSTPARPVFPLPPSGPPPPATNRFQDEASLYSPPPQGTVCMQPSPYMTPPHGPHQVAWTPGSALPPGMVPSPDPELMHSTHQVSQCSMVPIFQINQSPPPPPRGLAYGPYFIAPSPKSTGSGFKSLYSTKLFVAVGCMGVLLVGGAMGVALYLQV
mmetsp:Transcript_13087/g.37331  ORF Transcript_13087/g.37331 Transcript_13087/m.37331 type:complete len:478 (+) Transcript_13087:39-1472(+)